MDLRARWSERKTQVLVALLGGAMLGMTFQSCITAAKATQPNPDHKVTICHAHPADSIDGPWVAITVDVASVGYQQSGHQDEHDGDIIPPWEYTDVEGGVFSYPGKGDQAILENGCKALTPTPTPTPSDSPTPTPSTSTSPPPTVHTQPPPPDKPGKNTVNPPSRTASTGLDGKAIAAAAASLGLLLAGAWMLRLSKRGQA